MLDLVIEKDEIFHPKLNKFISVPSCVITLEHSLISIAKWESKWHIPYLSSTPKKTPAQEMDYIKCMVIGPVKSEYVFDVLTDDNIRQIRDYINDPMTATTFSKIEHNKTKKEVITAEALYFRMFANNIPIECQKWHLNRLLTLIKVCDLNNSPKKKMGKQQTAQWNAQQNALRRAKYNTKG